MVGTGRQQYTQSIVGKTSTSHSCMAHYGNVLHRATLWLLAFPRSLWSWHNDSSNGSLYIGKPSLWCILLRCGSFVTLGAKFGDTLGRAFVPNQWIFISTNGISRPSTCFVILIPIATLFLNLS